MSDVTERLLRGATNGVLIPCEDLVEAANEIERLREQLADTKDDYLRRHREACDRWEALMDIRMIANEPGDRRALIDKIFGIATKALRPIQEASRYASDVGALPPRAPSSQPAESAGAKTGGGK